MVASARAAALAGVVTLLSALGAAARTPTAEDLIALRDIGDYRGGLSFSPDGARVAFFEREADVGEDNYHYRLLLMNTSGGASRVIADAGAIILARTPYGYHGAPADRAPVWSPNGRAIAYLAMRDRRRELWRVSPDGQNARAVVTGPGDVLRYAWQDDDHLIVEMMGAREALAASIARQRSLGFHPDENFTPYSGLSPTAPPERNVVVVECNTGAQRAATDAEHAGLARERPIAGAIAYDHNAALEAWIAPITADDPAMSPLLGLYASRRGTAEALQCDRPQCAGQMMDAWVFGDDIVFRRMEGHGNGLTALYAWDINRNTVRRIRREDEELLGCGRAIQRLVCLQESARQPRRLIAIDIARGGEHLLYEPNPRWAQLDLTDVELIEAHDAYGNESFAHLVYPAGYVRGRRYPVVIVQYRSRGFLRGGVGWEYPIHPLAARGYFVLAVDRPEWRGAEAQLPYDELERRTELDGSENHMKQSALEAMLAELDRRGLSDPARIGITGLSDGAETVFWAITRSDLFAAAVASSPPTDPTAWWLGAETVRQALLARGAAGPISEASNPWAGWWQSNATVLHADSIQAPLLMNLGESEAMMGFPLSARLLELGRPVDVYIYPDAYHVKWRPRQILAAQHRAMDWLDFWLRDIETVDPEEPDRLERWRALRRPSRR